MSSSLLLRVQRRLLAFAAVLGTIAYLIWRVTTLDFGAPLQVFFLTLEFHAGLGFALFVFSVWDTDHLAPPDPRDDTPHRVAVCIATYNEDENVLLPTIAAAVALQPAHETWVLDDGDRPWVAAMAEQVGARYLTRTDRSHAKAGNLNNAFAVINADLYAILDADHIPTTNFLRHTLGYFDDPSVALVQTPQDFYNTDSFEHIGDYSEEALFYRVIQPGKNRWDAAFWCGTSAIVRGDAMRSIGGAATESVTEDLLTTIKLHRHGWRTVFQQRGARPRSCPGVVSGVPGAADAVGDRCHANPSEQGEPVARSRPEADPTVGVHGVAQRLVRGPPLDRLSAARDRRRVDRCQSGRCRCRHVLARQPRVARPVDDRPDHRRQRPPPTPARAVVRVPAAADERPRPPSARARQSRVVPGDAEGPGG
ncbi:MAG: cellulose synthase catalytic subunit [Acidimicrobiales bacterium]